MGVMNIGNKSRAEYMKTRREGKKQFNVLIDGTKSILLDEILVAQNKTKKDWLEDKIDEEINSIKK